MNATLRWVRWAEGDWHLRFGSAGPSLCEVGYDDREARTRRLSAGPPARRCAKCSEVIRLRLGLA